jgi:MFS transporter, ACS family, D-galactonate transporter
MKKIVLLRVESERDVYVHRWWQLLPLSLSLIALTFNWFAVAAVFPQLTALWKIDIDDLSNLIGVFVLGFAVLHLPAGILAYRIGLKKTLLLGLCVESVAGMLCALSSNLETLLFLRLIAGIGGGILVNMSFAMIIAWFRGRELVLALGISAATCFSLGQALGLLVWIPVSQFLGWRDALLAAGGFGMLVWWVCLLALRMPEDRSEHVSGGIIEWRAFFDRVVMNRDLWFTGLSFFGVYGAGLLTAQLLPTYLSQIYHFSLTVGSRYAALFVLLSIPGSLLGAFLSHYFRLLRVLFVFSWVLLGISISVFPFLGFAGVLLMVIVAGSGQQFGFSAWSSMPGYYSDRVRPQDIAASEGLILTIAGLGGFILPVLFGLVQVHFGYDAAFVLVGSISALFALFGLGACRPEKMVEVKRG